MQFFIRLNALAGIVVLLLFNSKALQAQQFYAPVTPAYGYAPSTQFGGYQGGYQGGYPVYPSPSYNAPYHQGYSYPPSPTVPLAPPTYPSPSTTVWNEATPAETVRSATETITPGSQTQPEPTASNSPDVSSVANQAPETELNSAEAAARGQVLDQMPSAASILKDTNDERSPSRAFANVKPNVEAPTVESAEMIPPNFSASGVTGATPVPDAVTAPKTLTAPQAVAAPKAVPQPLQRLLQIQSSMEAILPRLIPAVVAVEGGSGVIVSSQGHILTASHVTKKAGRRVMVRLADGRSVEATTLGTNVNSDTAALKLLGNGPWPYVKLGNSKNVELGDWSLTMGYPLDFQRGRPAAVRIGRIIRKTQSRFTSDSPIMGGDSGGPMFDLKGELIGISSRIKSDISQNIFVPIQRYQTEWHQLSSSIDVPRKKTSQPKPYLGILGESDFDRVRIRRVYQNSPAALAGLHENDVILSFGGKPVRNFDDVAKVLKSRKPGEEVIAQLNRYGAVLTVSVRLGSSDGS